MTQEKEQDLCSRTRNLSTADIMSRFPFSKAKVIKVVSFKKPSKEAIEWQIPKTVNGKIDMTRLFEVKALDASQTARLMDILMNYGYVPLSSNKAEKNVRVNLCYYPRHAILFEDRGSNILGYIEICIECLRYKTQPETLDVGEFCFDKYKLLEDFFRDVGIAYGIGQHGMPWIED